MNQPLPEPGKMPGATVDAEGQLPQRGTSPRGRMVIRAVGVDVAGAPERSTCQDGATHDDAHREGEACCGRCHGHPGQAGPEK